MAFDESETEAGNKNDDIEGLQRDVLVLECRCRTSSEHGHEHEHVKATGPRSCMRCRSSPEFQSVTSFALLQLQRGCFRISNLERNEPLAGNGSNIQ